MTPCSLESGIATAAPKPLRLLVVCPSWLGDCVMATPTLRCLREKLPGAWIGALVRPGMDEVLAGLPSIDEFHVARSSGVMGPKFIAAKLRPRRYDAALLLTNSFSTALTVRIAGIPKRIGYDRDARGLLLTERLAPPKWPSGRLAPVPAVRYYLHAAQALLKDQLPDISIYENRLSLFVSDADHAAAQRVFAAANVDPSEPRAILNPGGNNPAKRWPADRFAALTRHLADRGLRVFLNGSPGEADLVDDIAQRAGVKSSVNLPRLQITIGALKGITRASKLMVTNDTGPRHIAAAFDVPLVSLFGPTDPRWTTIPAPAGEQLLLADPTLPETEVADDHPDRCRIDRISLESVLEASERALAGRGRVQTGVSNPP
ncbi:MAG: lipopolysaccharide heptosyltransferase II [Planctomycetes bacterium]|nr:lipopolysaccharide heptosyltransferase II [Planctomycetota bacterium]